LVSPLPAPTSFDAGEVVERGQRDGRLGVNDAAHFLRLADDAQLSERPTF